MQLLHPSGDCTPVSHQGKRIGARKNAEPSSRGDWKWVSLSPYGAHVTPRVRPDVLCFFKVERLSHMSRKQKRQKSAWRGQVALFALGPHAAADSSGLWYWKQTKGTSSTLPKGSSNLARLATKRWSGPSDLGVIDRLDPGLTCGSSWDATYAKSLAGVRLRKVDPTPCRLCAA